MPRVVGGVMKIHYRRSGTSLALCGHSGFTVVFTDVVDEVTCTRCQETCDKGMTVEQKARRERLSNESNPRISTPRRRK